MQNKADLEKLSDEELMLAFSQANQLAFNIIYQRYSPKILGYFFSKLADRAKAEDLLQETFLKLYRFKENFDPAYSFAAWIFTISRNNYLDYLRKNKDDIVMTELDYVDYPELAPEASEQKNEPAQSFPEVITGLSESEQMVLNLRYAQDLGFTDIARHLGLTSANVRKIASRAVAKLRKKFQ